MVVMTVPPVAVVPMVVMVMAVVPVMVMAVVVHVTVTAVMAAAAVHHPTATAATTVVAAAAVTTAGFRARGERRQADNDRCGKGEDCSALEHFRGSFGCSAEGHPRSRARFLPKGAAGDCAGDHKMIESDMRGRAQTVACADASEVCWA